MAYSTTSHQPLVIRLAGADDTAVVARLAALDSSSPPEGSTLLAFRGDAPIAALGVTGRHVVADPFLPTADVIALLRERAAQLTEGRRRPRYAAAAARAVAFASPRAKRSATTR